MKQLKSFVALVLMSMFATVATAQTTKVQSNNVPESAVLTVEEVTAIRAALASTPAKAMGMLPEDSLLFVGLLDTNNEPLATRVAESGLLCGTQVEAGDSVRLFIVRTETGFDLFCDRIAPVVKKVTIQDRSAVARLDTAAIQSQFIEKQHEGRPRYKEVYQADQHDISDGVIVKRAMNMYGFGLFLAGAGQFGSDLNGLTGKFGMRYSVSTNNGRWFVMPEIAATLNKTRYNSNATTAGETYWSYATEATALFGVAFGKHKDHRLAIGPELFWEFYSTNSQPRYYPDGSWDELSSSGNYLGPGAKVRYEYDGYNWPVSLFTGVGIRQHKSVVQNAASIKTLVVTFEAGIALKLCRHKTNNK